MASFFLTIPINAIDTGVPAELKTYCFDRGFQRNVNHRVLRAGFGDGYSQRVKDGINTKDENISVAFKTRTATEINLLADYLDLKAGSSFPIVVTNRSGDETIQVMCTSYNLNYNYETVHTLTTTFMRVYEPE